MANGFTDHLAARLAVGASGPVLVCPAMNKAMWAKPSIARAVRTLGEFGYALISPGEGIEIETMQPSTSSLASIDRIIEALLTTLAW